MTVVRVAFVAWLAVWAAACSLAGHQPKTGPLDASGDPSAQCVPQPTEEPITFGLNVMKNMGRRPVQLRDVKLVDPHRIRVIDAKVLILRPGLTNLVGMWSTYPPDPAQLQRVGITWSAVEAVSSAIIQPGATANLVLEISRTTPYKEGAARAAEIDYTSGTRAYRATTNTAVRIVPTSQC